MCLAAERASNRSSIQESLALTLERAPQTLRQDWQLLTTQAMLQMTVDSHELDFEHCLLTRRLIFNQRTEALTEMVYQALADKEFSVSSVARERHLSTAV